MTTISSHYQRFRIADNNLREQYGSIINAFVNASNGTFKSRIAKDEKRHYPPSDFIDEVSGAQCFMHRHDSGRLDTLHIHFFYRWQPQNLALDQTITTHLAALDVSLKGEPIGWFLVNQWVVGDYWQNARKTKQFASQWRMGSSNKNRHLPNQLVANWLNAVLKLGLSSTIPKLLAARDERIDRTLSINPRRQILTDKRIENMGYLPFN
ncbi:MAG: hypothetical protein KGI88_07265 [Betaproteobacteria bacterium]|nr:hypothetical protein [Betaproteobacteria bacterium]MDE2057012.1 hypothetical protein [Betaproteobacteria bacterium]